MPQAPQRDAAEAAAAGDAAAASRAAEVSLNISRHLARVDVAVADFTSSSSNSSGRSSISSGSGDGDSDNDDNTSNVPTPPPCENKAVQNEDSAPAPAPAPAPTPAPAPVPAPSRRADNNSVGSGGSSSNSSSSGVEFFAEPEWQRVPGRWTKFEDDLLKEMKADLQDDLRAAPPFPEVTGSRRMLRFLRGHKHDAKKAAVMMRQMLKWRKENDVDAIREDIMQNQKFSPRQFPDGEMITRLFPSLVANPLCVDMDGGPISYESYDFSPREVTAHANGDLSFFIKFHIYCQEFKQICLDSLSDAKEMENLVKMAAERASPPSPPRKVLPNKAEGKPAGNSGGGGGGGGGGSSGGHASGGVDVDRGIPSEQDGRDGERFFAGAAGGGTFANKGDVAGAETLPSSDQGQERGQEIGQRQQASAEVVGDGVQRRGGEAAGGGEVAPGNEGEQKPWGVVLRNTIIRDLSGFGMEHAGPIGRSLISQVLTVSQDNYPEMMEKCYIINAPWVFYALWKGLTPLLSASTAKKVQVLKYDYLPKLCETISLDRLPVRAGGRCDPSRATVDQMHDFVVCGQAAPVPGAEGDGAGGVTAKGASGGGAGGKLAVITKEKSRDDPLAKQKSVERDGGGASTGDGGASPESSSRSVESNSVSGSGGGGGSGGGSESGAAAAAAAAAHKGGSKPNVTFRSLIERLQARDEPRDLLAVTVGAADVGNPRRSGSQPLARTESFQSEGSFLSPPLSTHGSSGGSGGGFRSRQNSRSSPGRPIASPGPRGIRRTNSAVGLVVRTADSNDSSGGITPTAAAAAGNELSPTSDDRAEDFDSRVVGRALKLSMKRKARRFKKSEAVCEPVGHGGGGSGGDGSGDDGPAPPSVEQSPDKHDRQDKGGWAKKKWRALKERREGRKMQERGFLADLPGLSAGDCAEWIPNSARNSCLHCERPFTLLLRRHHCRMCGELVCGQCSPHRVRLIEDEREGVVEDAGGHDTNADGDIGGDAADDDEGGKRGFFHRRHDNRGGGGESGGGEGGGASRRPSSSSRRGSANSGPRAVAVRVCTDCHFSLETVTVASSPTLSVVRPGDPGGDGHGEGDGDSDDNVVNDGAGDRDGGGDGGGGGGGNNDDDGGDDGLNNLTQSNEAAASGVNLGTGGGDADVGVGRGFVDAFEGVYATEEIAGDVLLEDVMEWGRIKRRASKCVEIVRMCLLVVVEMHHYRLLEVGLQLWRTLSAVISTVAKHAAAKLAAPSASPVGSPPPRADQGSGAGGDDREGDGDTSLASPPSLSPLMAAARSAVSDNPVQPPMSLSISSSSNSSSSNSSSSAGAGAGGDSGLPTEASGSSRDGTPLPPTPAGPGVGATVGADAAAAAPLWGLHPSSSASCEVLVAAVEAALWAGVDQAASYASSTWVLLMALLPFIFWLW